MTRTIAYFTDSQGFGGAERYLLQIFETLDQAGWKAVLYFHDSPGILPLIDEARRLGVAARSLPPMPLGLQGARRVPAFAHLLQQDRPDIFHANLTWPLSCKFGLAAAALSRVPVILATLHSFPQVDLGWPTRLQLRLLGQWIDRYILVSFALSRQIRRTFWIPEAKLRVIHNGIPIASPRSPATLPAAKTVTGPPIVFTAARLDEQKGLEYLVQAAARVPQATFFLAGEGPEHDHLQALVRGLGLENRFHFLGFQPEINSWLGRADLFVLPSLSEGQPLSILEAMAAGKPVVASQIEGIDEEVIAGETGLLVPPADPLALAGAIQTLLADPARARAMGQLGKERVLRYFRLENMLNNLLSTYEEMLSRRETVLAQR